MEVRERIEYAESTQERLFDRLGAAELHGDIEDLIGGFSPAGKQLPKRVQSAGARLAGNKPFRTEAHLTRWFGAPPNDDFFGIARTISSFQIVSNARRASTALKPTYPTSTLPSTTSDHSGRVADPQDRSYCRIFLDERAELFLRQQVLAGNIAAPDPEFPPLSVP